jgi:hypothetical protein
MVSTIGFDSLDIAAPLSGPGEFVCGSKAQAGWSGKRIFFPSDVVDAVNNDNVAVSLIIRGSEQQGYEVALS